MEGGLLHLAALATPTGSIDWVEVTIAIFTGATAIIAGLALMYGRSVAGHGQAIRIGRPKANLYVEGPLRHMHWADRTKIRCATMHIFNRSEKRQTIKINLERTHLALTHFLTGVLLCIPIITIPLAIQNFKLAGLALAPFGKEIVSNAEAQRRRAYYQAGAAAGWQGSPTAPSPPALAPPNGDDISF